MTDCGNIAKARAYWTYDHGKIAKTVPNWTGVKYAPTEQAFDRILLDAPCSATGVIRRHPDIKILRRAADIKSLVELQAQILDAVWLLLKPGGMLIYATCSVLPRENSAQITAFTKRCPDALPVSINANWGQASGLGRQILPGENGMDGFYYACLRKDS